MFYSGPMPWMNCHTAGGQTFMILKGSSIHHSLYTTAGVKLITLASDWSLPAPSPPLDNIWVMVIVWRLRRNIIRTALCWIVWHNVHSQQHTYLSSSYRSNRLGLSHWDPYAVRRGGCLELYYCNIVEWFWWDSSLISTTNCSSSNRTYRLTWHKLNTIASRTLYKNYKEKN